MNLDNATNNYPLISIVIPVFRSASTLPKVLQSILNLDYPKDKIEVVFSYYPADDGSGEIIQEFKEKYKDYLYQVKIILRRERGVSYARNLGIKNSSGDYIFLLDDDVILKPPILKEALSALKRDGRIAAVTFPYLIPNDIIGKAVMYKFLGKRKYAETIFTGAALIRKNIFKITGYFNECLGYPYTMAHEDIEFSARIRKKGFKILVDGRYILTHLPKVKSHDYVYIKSRYSSRVLEQLYAYFTYLADQYIRYILPVAPLKWKLELVFYILLPLMLILFLLTDLNICLMFLILSYVLLALHYRIKTLSTSYLPIMVLLGRVIRAYGIIFRLTVYFLKSALKPQ